MPAIIRRILALNTGKAKASDEYLVSITGTDLGNGFTPPPG
jgi:hypothetical protein